MAEREVDPFSLLIFWPLYLLSFMFASLPTLPQFPTPTTTSSPTSSSPKTSYSNIEEWEIKELPDGTVKMIIHRKAQRG